MFLQNHSTLLLGSNSLMQDWRSFLRAHAQIVYKILSRAKRSSPSLLGIPAFDRMAGLYNKHLNPNREYACANDLEVRLRPLTDVAKELRPDGPGLIMGGINFA